MDICAIISEFNPFHNGHAYLLERARALSGCDAVLCIMSGSFTQRGDMCVLDKYARARHAVKGGADIVLELPAPFAVAPAEIFAGGAVNILSAIPDVKYLAFGCEDECDFDALAERLGNEDGAFRARLASLMDGGLGYAAAYSLAAGGDGQLLRSPNNILATEYAKANIKYGRKLALMPVKRRGMGYSSGELGGEFASAKAIRENRTSKEVAKFVPPFVLADLAAAEDRTARFEQLAADGIYFAKADDLARVFGCSEGLENRLKKLCPQGYKGIVGGATGKRYSATRIRRILAANLLGLYADETKAELKKKAEARVLAVRRDRADELLPLFPAPAPSPLTELTDRSYELWRYINYPFGEQNVRQKINFV